MVTAEKLSFGYPHKDLYDKVSFHIEEGAHCAFIGTNGCGKSTLLQMIRNAEDFLYDGKLILAENLKTGYVSQFYEHGEEKDCTVYEYISREFVALENQIASLCEEMAVTDDMETVFEKYQNALDRFSAIDGDHYESNIKKQLKVAHLTHAENLSVNQISGGEFKLVQIVKEMLTTPGLLLMDEPDVFLDFEHLIALADLINGHKGTLLVITHNRFLLQHCFDKILHLENAQIQEFNGSYMEYNYLMLCNKIELQQLADADKEEIERQTQIVEKLRKTATMIDNSSIGRALHARVSLLERLEKRKTKDPFVDIFSPDISFREETAEQGPLLSVTDYTLSFDELLLEHVSFSIDPGEKIAIVGENGTGKTTMLRDLAKAVKDSIQYSEQAKVGYLSQLQGETLQEKHLVKEEFAFTGKESDAQIEEYLEQYGFGERINSRIESLSGGEKNILQIAKIAARPTNLLLLDEPTSHLDTYAQIALEKAISAYRGAVLMVSHDFYTIVNCVDTVYFVEDKTIRKMSMRAFRKMIYANQFDKNYLEIEQKKKELENRIETALSVRKYEIAEVLTKELEECIQKMLSL